MDRSHLLVEACNKFTLLVNGNMRLVMDLQTRLDLSIQLKVVETHTLLIIKETLDMLVSNNYNTDIPILPTIRKTDLRLVYFKEIFQVKCQSLPLCKVYQISF